MLIFDAVEAIVPTSFVAIKSIQEMETCGVQAYYILATNLLESTLLQNICYVTICTRL